MKVRCGGIPTPSPLHIARERLRFPKARNTCRTALGTGSRLIHQIESQRHAGADACESVRSPEHDTHVVILSISEHTTKTLLVIPPGHPKGEHLLKLDLRGQSPAAATELLDQVL